MLNLTGCWNQKAFIGIDNTSYFCARYDILNPSRNDTLVTKKWAYNHSVKYKEDCGEKDNASAKHTSENIGVRS